MAQQKTIVAQGVTALFLAGLPETVPGRVSAGQLTGAFQCPHCNKTITLMARFTDASLKDLTSSRTDVGRVTSVTPDKEVVFNNHTVEYVEIGNPADSEKEVLDLSQPGGSGPVGPVRPSWATTTAVDTWAGKAQVSEAPLETPAIPLLTGESVNLLYQPPPDATLTRYSGRRRVTDLFYLTPPPGPETKPVPLEPKPVGQKREVPIPAQAFTDGYEICYGAKTYSETKLIGEKNKGLLTGTLATLHDAGADLSRLREWWSWYKGWAKYPHPSPYTIVSTWTRFVSEVEHNLAQVVAPTTITGLPPDEEFALFQRNVDAAWEGQNGR